MADAEWQPERPVPQLERRQVEPELQLARERLELQRSFGQASQLASCSAFGGASFYKLFTPATEHFPNFI